MAQPKMPTTFHLSGRLQTDVIDLVQFHGVIRTKDPDRIFAPGGAIGAAISARESGKIRYIPPGTLRALFLR
jgi:hypothetical protein